VRGIAIQYWFYYWFNHFNDLHESDWEMIQLAFDAPTPRGALTRGPKVVAYAQHGGGETAGWEDAKVEKEATHPVVYVASGPTRASTSRPSISGAAGRAQDLGATTRGDRRTLSARGRSSFRPSRPPRASTHG
jgi:hypothetical protein